MEDGREVIVIYEYLPEEEFIVKQQALLELNKFMENNVGFSQEKNCF